MWSVMIVNMYEFDITKTLIFPVQSKRERETYKIFLLGLGVLNLCLYMSPEETKKWWREEQRNSRVQRATLEKTLPSWYHFKKTPGAITITHCKPRFQRRQRCRRRNMSGVETLRTFTLRSVPDYT